MKNKLCVMLALLLVSTQAFSQQADSLTFKNQLGIIAGPSLPIGVIYKRQVKTDQAWRFTGSGNYGKQSNSVRFYGTSNDFEYYKMKHSNLYLQALIGYEWQNNFSKRCTFYYGADAGIGFGKGSNNYDFDNFTPNSAGSYSFQRSSTSYQNYLLKPMAGIKFNLNSKLYLSVESSFNLIYFRNTTKDFVITFTENQNEPLTTEQKPNSNQSFDMSFSPISNIQLVYKF